MIPITINICGIPHAIIPCADNFTMDSHFAEINYTKAEIRVNQDMPETMQIQSIIHEWVHGALVMIGRNQESQDENLVQCLAMAINQTFTIRD